MEPLFGVLLSLRRGTPRHGEWVIACLDGAWSKLLGERLAAVCRPAKFEGSELMVEILDKNWEGAVESIKPALLDKLRAATAGEVQSIVVFSRLSAVGSA